VPPQRGGSLPRSTPPKPSATQIYERSSRSDCCRRIPSSASTSLALASAGPFSFKPAPPPEPAEPSSREGGQSGQNRISGARLLAKPCAGDLTGNRVKRPEKRRPQLFYRWRRETDGAMSGDFLPLAVSLSQLKTRSSEVTVLYRELRKPLLRYL